MLPHRATGHTKYNDTCAEHLLIPWPELCECTASYLRLAIHNSCLGINLHLAQMLLYLVSTVAVYPYILTSANRSHDNEINIVLRGIDFVLSVCATHPLGSVRCMLLLKARPDQIGC